MSVDYFLTRLREIFYEPPSAEAWDSLCALFNKWPWTDKEGLDVGLDYAHSHLAAWPDTLRVPHDRWLDALFKSMGTPETHRRHHAWPLVKTLNLSLFECDEAARIALFREGALANISRLTLSAGWRQPFTQKVLTAMASTTDLLRLTHLAMDRYCVPVEDLPLLQKAILPELKVLKYGSKDMGEAGGKALAAMPWLAGVNQANLDRCLLGDDGLAALVRSEHLTALQFLNLGSNGISRTGLAALLAAPWFGRVTHLVLERNAIDIEGLRLLIDSPNARGLVHLSLRACRLDGKAFRMLARSPFLSQLKYLDLLYNPHHDKGAWRALLRSPHLRDALRPVIDKQAPRR